MGPRVSGGYNNEVLAVNFLKQEINIIQQTAHQNQKIHNDVQVVSGGYWLGFKPEGITKLWLGLWTAQQFYQFKVWPVSTEIYKMWLWNWLVRARAKETIRYYWIAITIPYQEASVTEYINWKLIFCKYNLNFEMFRR